MPLRQYAVECRRLRQVALFFHQWIFRNLYSFKDRFDLNQRIIKFVINIEVFFLNNLFSILNFSFLNIVKQNTRK